MQTSRGYVSVQNPHIEALRARHAMLAQRIDDAMKHPSTDDLALRMLKLQKLKLKDEISIQERRTG